MAKKSLFQEREENLMKRVGYWRKNPHKFVNEYLGLNLKLFQKFLLYLMFKNNFFLFIACRGIGKSYLTAICAVVRCILYPNTKVVISSGVKNQSSLIITEKIQDLYNRSFALRHEIKELKTGINSAKVEFKNGSKITPVTSSDNARGYRSNLLIIDEYRLVDYSIISEILIPMNNVPRELPFKEKYPEKYKDYIEPNHQVYLSSAWYKKNWAWQWFGNHFNGMINGGSYMAFSIPYQLSVKEGLLMQEDVDAIKSSNMFDPIKFQMEYEGIFAGDTDKSFFKLDEINKNRVITKAFIPPTDDEFAENKALSRPKSLCNIPKIDGEIRIISMDVALSGNSGGRRNDTSVIVCVRMIPSINGYERSLVYIESIYGSIESSRLATKFKRIFYDFESDFAVLDVNGLGFGVYDSLAGILRDDERDIEYEPWVSINDDSLKERYTHLKGKPVLYTVKANAKFNNDIAVGLRNDFANGKLKLLITDIQKREEFVANNKEFLLKSPEEQNRQILPFIQTSLFATELVNLEYEVLNANVKIKESGMTTKDRYSAVAYANYYANEIEMSKSGGDEEDDLDDFMFSFSWRK